jgi:soluble lytic murein transglycosylase-like protein
MAVFSVMSVGALGSFYQITQHKVGSQAISSDQANFPKDISSQIVKIEKEPKYQPAVEVQPTKEQKQHKILKAAYSIAKSVGLKRPEIALGILLQESKAGTLDSYKVAGQEYGLRTNDRYYGIGQIKLRAAKAVMDRFPKLWEKYKFHTHTDEELIANLILNDLFNIEISARYLKILSMDYGYEGDKLVAAYNKGPGGVRNYANPSSLDYVQQVKQKIRSIQ